MREFEGIEVFLVNVRVNGVIRYRWLKYGDKNHHYVNVVIVSNSIEVLSF